MSLEYTLVYIILFFSEALSIMKSIPFTQCLAHCILEKIIYKYSLKNLSSRS